MRCCNSSSKEIVLGREIVMEIAQSDAEHIEKIVAVEVFTGTAHGYERIPRVN